MQKPQSDKDKIIFQFDVQMNVPILMSKQNNHTELIGFKDGIYLPTDLPVYEVAAMDVSVVFWNTGG